MPYPSPNEGNPFAIIGDVMENYANALVQISRANTASSTNYDPKADSGGAITPALIWVGKALVQRIRRPGLSNNTTQWVASSPFGFQLLGVAPGVLVEEGMTIRVTRGGDDPTLTQLQFIVTVGVSGSWSPVQLVETVAVMNSVYNPDPAYFPYVPWDGVVEDPNNPGYFVP